MRPTLRQLYNDPLTIIAALEVAGLNHAHEKVMGMMMSLCEYWSMDRYYKRLNKDRTYVLQSEERRNGKTGQEIDKIQVMRNRKQAGEYNKTLIVARSYLRRKGAILETKIAKWPEIDLDPEKLRDKPDQNFISKVLKKKMRRRKPRTHIFG